MKGWIALDIDGTITEGKYSVPQEVVAFLRQLTREGWRIAMATGRPFTFASLALSEFDFPYVFLPQNGSVAFEMPSKKLLFKRYIPTQAIRLAEEAYEGIDTDFLIYAGYEKRDCCYWRPHRFPKEDLPYLANLRERQKEAWHSVENFSEAHLDSFPLLKCFGRRERMEKVAARLSATQEFEVALIRDPFEEGYVILLVTHRGVNKGSSLKEVFRLLGRGEKVIAAGDDENDRSLLQEADLKIAMAHAPESLQKMADFIASPTKDLGIIQALQWALRNGY